jgi:excisionase family DNA binding protein
MKQERMLTVREAAWRLGLTLSHVYHLTWVGRLPGARKVGKTWRIPGSVVEARLKAERCRNAASD